MNIFYKVVIVCGRESLVKIVLCTAASMWSGVDSENIIIYYYFLVNPTNCICKIMSLNFCNFIVFYKMNKHFT